MTNFILMMIRGAILGALLAYSSESWAQIVIFVWFGSLFVRIDDLEDQVEEFEAELNYLDYNYDND